MSAITKLCLFTSFSRVEDSFIKFPSFHSPLLSDNLACVLQAEPVGPYSSLNIVDKVVNGRVHYPIPGPLDNNCDLTSNPASSPRRELRERSTAHFLVHFGEFTTYCRTPLIIYHLCGCREGLSKAVR